MLSRMLAGMVAGSWSGMVDCVGVLLGEKTMGLSTLGNQCMVNIFLVNVMYPGGEFRSRFIIKFGVLPIQHSGI